MQNQTKPEPLGAPMVKMILVVAMIISLGAVLGVAGYLAKNKRVVNLQPQISPVSGLIENSFIGTLIPGGVECRLFQADDGMLYSLEGAGRITEVFNNGDRVNIKGNFVEKSYCMQGKKVINLTEINYAKDETANWKTYRNEEYGFELKYPAKEWEVKEYNDYILRILISSDKWRSGMPEGGGSVDISIENINLNDFVANYIEENKDYCENPILKREKFIINNIEAEKITGCTAIGLDHHYIFISKNNRSYILNFQDYDPIHNQILSTFKFTGSTKVESSEVKNAIIYPDKQAVWKIGETYLIWWTPKDSSGYVGIRLYKVPVVSLNLEWEEPSNNISDTGNYSFNVFKGLESGNKYQFIITQYPSGENLTSEEFTIIEK